MSSFYESFLRCLQGCWKNVDEIFATRKRWCRTTVRRYATLAQDRGHVFVEKRGLGLLNYYTLSQKGLDFLNRSKKTIIIKGVPSYG